jgi:hypothetical protein
MIADRRSAVSRREVDAEGTGKLTPLSIVSKRPRGAINAPGNI